MGHVFASLRSRVFAATALVAVVSMGAVLGYVTARLTRQAEAELVRQLEEAMRIVDQQHRVRLETGRERALLMADVPMLKAAVRQHSLRQRRPTKPVPEQYWTSRRRVALPGRGRCAADHESEANHRPIRSLR